MSHKFRNRYTYSLYNIIYYNNLLKINIKYIQIFTTHVYIINDRIFTIENRCIQFFSDYNMYD